MTRFPSNIKTVCIGLALVLYVTNVLDNQGWLIGDRSVKYTVVSKLAQWQGTKIKKKVRKN